MRGVTLDELAPGLWRWTLRHPEWHPGDFGAEVACFAARAGDDLLLIDPLVTDEAMLDPLVRGERVSILVSIPYHVRSAEALAERYDADVWGHPAVGKRLSKKRRLREIEPGAELPGGACAHAIGKPRRYEMPIHLPSHHALVFGDAVVTTPDGDLRVWSHEKVDRKRATWYAEHFAPTLEPLLGLGLERILVTHGEPVLSKGSAALEAALRAEPWYHRG